MVKYISHCETNNGTPKKALVKKSVLVYSVELLFTLVFQFIAHRFLKFLKVERHLTVHSYLLKSKNFIL